MDAQKFTGKQLFTIALVSIAVQVIGGFILYQLTKPKATDPGTSPAPTNLGTAPTATTVPTTTTTTQG